MSIRLILAATAALAVAAPVLAQEAATQTPPATAPAPAPTVETPEQAAFEARAEAFEARMEAMEGEMQAAVTASAGDQARLSGDLDVIVARYQPDADAFAGELSAFLASQSASMSEEQRTALVQVGPMLQVQIKGAPAERKAAILRTAAAPATPAPAAPAAPQ